MNIKRILYLSTALLMGMLMSDIVMAEPVTGDVSEGDIVVFGNYEQDNDLDNGLEPIEWEVLQIRDGNALLLSHYALDSQPYNQEIQKITWEHCSLRYWLNEEFMNIAFTASEAEQIMETTVINRDNPVYETKGGKDTKDKVFILGFDEIEQYYDIGPDTWDQSNEELVCQLTYFGRERYIEDKAVYYGESLEETKEWYQQIESKFGHNACDWWLRSPGGDSRKASLVLYYGVVLDSGDPTYDACAGVRPAIWVDENALIKKTESEVKPRKQDPMEGVWMISEVSIDDEETAISGYMILDQGEFQIFFEDDLWMEGIWKIDDMAAGKASVLLLTPYGSYDEYVALYYPVDEELGLGEEVYLGCLGYDLAFAR